MSSTLNKNLIMEILKKNRTLIVVPISIGIISIFFRQQTIILLSIFICSLSMIYKRYISLSIGIDFCLVFALLSSSKFGGKAGAFVGGLSFLLGMILSMEITKSPVTTIYGTLFYSLIGFVGALIPASIIFAYSLMLFVVINGIFFVGLFMLGAPIEFLIRYTFTNLLGNFLFIRIFEGLLKFIF